MGFPAFVAFGGLDSAAGQTLHLHVPLYFLPETGKLLAGKMRLPACSGCNRVVVRCMETYSASQRPNPHLRERP
jgi:hypothetical protein